MKADSLWGLGTRFQFLPLLTPKHPSKPYPRAISSTNTPPHPTPEHPLPQTPFHPSKPGISQASLGFLILLPQLSKCWHYRHEPPQPAQMFLPSSWGIFSWNLFPVQKSKVTKLADILFLQTFSNIPCIFLLFFLLCVYIRIQVQMWIYEHVYAGACACMCVSVYRGQKVT